MSNLEKNLFESIDQLIDAKLNQISFDKTITATIIDDSNADKNQYYVQSGNDKFYAYANGGVYINGSQVYVTIPQGDYSMKKLIIGAYDSNKFDEEVLTSPLKRMVNISGNLLSAVSAGPISSEITTIGSAFTYDPTKFDVGVPVKYLGFSSNIITSGISEAVRGNYGFAIVKSKEDDKYEWSDFLYSFDCTQFLGNPYNYFDPGFKQEIVFDASAIDKATELKLIFYHRDNFQKADGTPTSTPGFTISNLLLCYGPSAEDYKTSKDKKELILWSETNGYTVKDATSSQIDIRAKWIHEDPDEPGTYITKENAAIEGNGVSLTLYRYMPGIEDLGAGPHWAKAVKKTYAADFEQMENGAVGPVTPLRLQIKDRGDYYTFPYANNGTSAWQTKLETTGKAYTDTNSAARVDWSEGTGVDLILVPFKDAVNSREDFKAILEKTTNHSDVKCMIMENVTVSLSLGQENIVPGTIQLTSAKKNGDTITNVVFNEKNKTIKIGSNAEQSITINYEKGTIKLANGGKFIEEDNNKDQTIEYELYFKFNSSIKITSNTLSFAKVEEGGDTQTPGDRNAELTFFYHKTAKYKGVYQVYGYDQEILDNQLGYKDEEIWVQFADGDSKFQAGDIVKFWIPKNATMLLPPKDTTWDSLTWSESKETNDNWYVYEHTISAVKASLKLHYKINSHYSRNANNNTIKCTVNSTKKESKDNTEINVQQAVISGTKDLEFRMMGSSGTDYTLVIDMWKADSQGNLLKDTKGNEIRERAWGMRCAGYGEGKIGYHNSWQGVYLELKLYDQSGNSLTFNKNNVNWAHIGSYASSFMKLPSEFAKYHETYCPIGFITTGQIELGHPLVIRATLTNWITANGKQVDLIADISIPIIRYPFHSNDINANSETGNNYADLEQTFKFPFTGTTRVIYDNEGKNPIYYNEPLKLKNHISNTDYTDIQVNGKMIGQIITKDGNKFYQPPADLMLYEGLNKDKAMYQYVFDDLVVRHKYNNEYPIIWEQRVLLERNPYESSLLNTWTGKLTIDNQNNYLLSAMVGAGTMSDQNKFTGVLMGSIGKAFDNKQGVHGLYGYKEGANTFKITEDGDAYFEGRITAQEGVIGNPGVAANAAVWKIGSFRDGSTTYWNSIFATRNNGVDDRYRAFFRVPDSLGSVVLGVKKYSSYSIDNGEELTDKLVGNDGEYIFRLNNDGSIFSTSGTIGGWKIRPGYLGTSIYQDGSDYENPKVNDCIFQIVSAKDTKDHWLIAQVCKEDGKWETTFRVKKNGDAYFKGSIHATDLVLSTSSKGTINSLINSNAKVIKASDDAASALEKVEQLPTDYMTVETVIRDVDLNGDGVISSDEEDIECWRIPAIGGEQNPFVVPKNSGVLYANNAIIKGTIFSQRGEIGNWTIGDFTDAYWSNNNGYTGSIYSLWEVSTSEAYRVFMRAPTTNDKNAVIGVKKYNGKTNGLWTNTDNEGNLIGDDHYQFMVRANGELIAKNANIKGEITATGGKIGELVITTSGLKHGDSFIMTKNKILVETLETYSTDAAAAIRFTTGYIEFKPQNDSRFYSFPISDLYAIVSRYHNNQPFN